MDNQLFSDNIEPTEGTKESYFFDVSSLSSPTLGISSEAEVQSEDDAKSEGSVPPKDSGLIEQPIIVGEVKTKLSDVLKSGASQSLNSRYHIFSDNNINRKAAEAKKESPEQPSLAWKDKFLLYKKLPFISRKIDFGTWVDRHKMGISVTALAYIIGLFAFASVRFDIVLPNMLQGVLVEVPLEEEPEPDPIKPEPKPEKEPDRNIYEEVKNVAISSNAKLDGGLKDDKGTKASDIYNDAKQLQQKLDASRAAAERSQSELDAMNVAPPVNNQKKGSNETKREESKVSGNVTVEYDLINRVAQYLPVPAYQCQNGGRVIIDITVDRNGDVVSASVNRTGSSTDNCITSMALSAARSSRFDVSPIAPAKQQGTITYLFMAQ